MSEGLRPGQPSPIEVVAERSEPAHTPSEVLGPQCGVEVTLEDTLVGGSGAHAEGVIRCDVSGCTFWNYRFITGDVEAGAANDPKAAAEAKVLSRARRQMTSECVVWRKDPENNGQDIPNSRLPQILQRHQS